MESKVKNGRGEGKNCLFAGFTSGLPLVSDLAEKPVPPFAVIRGFDPLSTRIDPLIHMANERKHDAKYAYLHHLETHGCSKLDEPDKE
jgi:hypothetical protein